MSNGRLKSAYYRKWGAAIARANAGLRRARLEYVGGRGNRVREYAADGGLGVAAPGALGELVADVGGGFGGGFRLATPPLKRAAAETGRCGRSRWLAGRV